MVDAFLDIRGTFTHPPAVVTPDRVLRAEEGLGAIRFLHPLLRLLDRDPRERYRKAAQRLLDQWLEELPGPLDPPSSRYGRDPDSSAAALLVEAALEALARRMKVPDVEALVALLLPWVWVGKEEVGGPSVALVDSFSRPRWKPCPYRLAYMCLRLAPHCGDRSAQLLRRIAHLSLKGGERFPLGTGQVQRLRWVGVQEKGRRPPVMETGPVDARVFVAEVGACLGMEADGLW